MPNKLLTSDRTLAVTVTASSTGLATAQFPPVPPGQFWTIKRSTINCNPQNTTVNEFNLYVGPPVPGAGDIRDHSYSGDGDVSDEISPVPCDPGDYITGIWGFSGSLGGAAAGALCTLTVTVDQYSIRG